MLCHDSPHCTSHNQVYFMKSRESAWWTIVCDNCVLCKKWLSNIRSPLPRIYIFTSRLGAWSCGKPCVNVQLVGTSCEFLYRATLASPVRLRSYTITLHDHITCGLLLFFRRVYTLVAMPRGCTFTVPVGTPTRRARQRSIRIATDQTKWSNTWELSGMASGTQFDYVLIILGKL